MYLNGIEEAVTMVMAPHYSKMSIGKYWDEVNQAQAEHSSNIKFTFVDSWYRQPKFLQAVENHVRAGLEKFSPEVRDKVKLVFSAHSLPARLLEMGDPYDDELKDNARRVVERLGDVDWMFSYQSAAETGEPWLGPQIEDVVVDLAQAGYKHMLVAPIGFVCDHVEILYDIDIEAKQIADEYDLQLERIESMNTTPLFIEAVVDAILEKA
jgi:ferrochelatase